MEFFPLGIYNLVRAEICVNNCVIFVIHAGIGVSAGLVLALRRK